MLYPWKNISTSVLNANFYCFLKGIKFNNFREGSIFHQTHVACTHLFQTLFLTNVQKGVCIEKCRFVTRTANRLLFQSKIRKYIFILVKLLFTDNLLPASFLHHEKRRALQQIEVPYFSLFHTIHSKFRKKNMSGRKLRIEVDGLIKRRRKVDMKSKR